MDHLKQVQRAIDYIESHLQDELKTESIARVAGFSTWHFQIVFSSAVGDTLKEYIRKRRLTAALIALGSSNRRLIEIALDAGFESQEAFTRAFKAMFGKTPGTCRGEGARSVMSLNKPKITMEYLDHLYGRMNMEPRFEKIDEMKMIGLETRFISIRSPEKNNHVVIPKLWDDFIKRAHEIKGRKGAIDFGVCSALGQEQAKSHPDECFYLAGAEVRDLNEIPPGMLAMKIPAGQYAIFSHKGKLDKLEHTMNYIFGSWLPKSGKKLRDAPDLEVYGDRFDPKSEKSEFDIYIPIQ